MLIEKVRAEVDALVPGTVGEDGASRRTALKVAVGLGYAAAAAPIMAQTVIQTPTDGLRAGRASVKVGDTELPLYYAAPAGKADLPVILVVQEIFGVHEHIADVCRRFAKAGYLAVAPELYVRQGNAAAYTDIPKLMAEVVSKVPDAQVMADLDATLQWASTQGGDVRRAGITGFCWGGRITWLYAQHTNKVRAGVAWYGRLVGTASPLTPRHPVDGAAALQAPVLGLYGEADTGIPVATVNQMKEALAAAGAQGNAAAKASEFVVYPEAPHAFHADYRPTYRKAAAEDGFQRALAWFKAKGAS